MVPVSRFANWLVSMADRWARWRHLKGVPVEPDMVIGPQGPKLRYVKPETTEEYGWDDKHYERGNIHFKGFHNPVQLVAQESEETETGYIADGGPQETAAIKQVTKVGLLPSSIYKTALVGNDAIPKALNPEPFDEIRKIVLACAAMSGLSLFAIIVLFTQL